MEIAATLRNSAQQRQLTVYQIAKDTGLNQSAMNQFYSGTKTGLRHSTVQLLFDYLGLEIRHKKAKRR